MARTATTQPVGCPSWCARRHGDLEAADAQVHVSGALQVRRKILRLVLTVDPESGVSDGPYVMVGPDEYTLHEAEVLIAALTQLVDEAAEATSRAVPRMRTPGP